jgi:hypothetical protein
MIAVRARHEARNWAFSLPPGSYGLEEGMSALGQKPTCAAQKGMSALHPKATVKADIRNGHVCFTPESGRVRCN